MSFLEKMGIGRRSKKLEIEPGLYYATFGDRLLASTIDSALSWLALSYIMDAIAAFVYRGFNINDFMYRLQAELQNVADHAVNVGAFDLLMQVLGTTHRLMLETGAWDRFITNYVVQLSLFTAIILSFWFTRGGTPGKMILKMHIVDATTFGEPTRGQYVLRYLGYTLAFLPLMLGFLWIGIDKRKQGWHDKLAKTVVVVDKRKKEKEAAEKP